MRCQALGRFALPASGFASFRNTFGRSGEQGPALGSGRRARPHKSATSGRNSAPFAQPRPRARLFPLQLDPALEGGGEPELTLCTMGPGSSPTVASKGPRAPSLLLRLFASRFAFYLHIWSELPFLFPPCTFFFHPNTTGPLRDPPHKSTRQLLFFLLLPLTRQGVSELGRPAQPASLLLSCVQWGGSPLQENEQLGMYKSKKKPAQEKTVLGPRGFSQSGARPLYQRDKTILHQSHVQGGGRGQRGSSRWRGRSGPRAPCPQHSPLKDASILAT